MKVKVADSKEEEEANRIDDDCFFMHEFRYFFLSILWMRSTVAETAAAFSVSSYNNKQLLLSELRAQRTFNGSFSAFCVKLRE